MLSDFIMGHGGALILPLAVIEGPVVAVVAGILATRGVIEWPSALALLVLGDVVGDVLWYSAGRCVRTPLSKLGRRFGMQPVQTAELEHRLRADQVRMLLIGKWTHAIGFLVLLGAGTLRVNIGKFLAVSLLGSLPKCALLLAVGMFAAQLVPRLSDHAALASIVLVAVGLGAVAMTLLGGWRQATRNAPP
jgi:membrane-associated protein